MWVGIGTFVSGGLLGSLATVYATRRESQDRRDVLILEREKFEHERDKDLRQRKRDALLSAKAALQEITEFMYDAYNHDRSRLDAYMGEFHEARVHYGAVMAAGQRLADFGMRDVAEQIDIVSTAFTQVIGNFESTTYRSWVDASMQAGRAVDAELARIP